jgi:hypothetical protein
MSSHVLVRATDSRTSTHGQYGASVRGEAFFICSNSHKDRYAS